MTARERRGTLARAARLRRRRADVAPSSPARPPPSPCRRAIAARRARAARARPGRRLASPPTTPRCRCAPAPARSPSCSPASPRWPRVATALVARRAAAEPIVTGLREDVAAPPRSRWSSLCSPAAAATPRARARAAAGATAADAEGPDGDGALNNAAGEPLVDRGRERATPAGDARHVRAAHRPARPRRGVASRVPFLDRYGEPFPPRSGRRRRSACRSPRRRPGGRTARARRPWSSPATSPTTRSATSSTRRSTLLDGGEVDPDSGAPGYAACRPPTTPTRSTTGPTSTRRGTPACSPPRSGPSARPASTRRGTRRGNHDVLLQGELPPDDRTDAVATGDRLVTSLDPRASCRDRIDDRDEPSTRCSRRRGPAARYRPGRPASAGTSTRPGSSPPAPPPPAAPAAPDRLDYAFDFGRPSARSSSTTAAPGGSAAPVTRRSARLAATSSSRARAIAVVAVRPPPAESSDGGEAALAILDATPRWSPCAGDSHRNRSATRGATG